MSPPAELLTSQPRLHRVSLHSSNFLFFSCQMPETFNSSRVLKYTYKKWMCWEIRVLALLFNDVSNGTVMREIITHTHTHTHTHRQPNVLSFQMKLLTLGQLCTRCENEAASQSSVSFFNAKFETKNKLFYFSFAPNKE